MSYFLIDEGIHLENLGEYYTDMLQLESFIKKSSLSAQAETLLRTCLFKRAQYRNEMLEHLAWKRQISVDALKKQILISSATQLSQDEIMDMEQMGESLQGKCENSILIL